MRKGLRKAGQFLLDTVIGGGGFLLAINEQVLPIVGILAVIAGVVIIIATPE